MNDEIVCPSCQGVNLRGCEYEAFDGPSDTSEIDCGWCERPLVVTRYVSASYHTALAAALGEVRDG
jgi:hypothetical protein